MKRHAAKKGFTLIEIVITLVILAVLAAVAVPSFVRWIDDAQQKKCMYELLEIKSDYHVAAVFNSYRVDDAGPLFLSAAESYGGQYGGSGTGFTCPCGNPGIVIFAPDKASVISIRCSVHGTLTATTADYLSSLWNTVVNQDTKQSMADYFSTRLTKGSSLDSGGGNWAPGVHSQLVALGIDTADDTWSIIRSTSSTAYIYWTSIDISGMTSGDTVTCARVKINTTTGEIMEGTQETGTVTIKTKTIETKVKGVYTTFNYLADGNSKDKGAFIPDA